jgi:hypothetical protein
LAPGDALHGGIPQQKGESPEPSWFFCPFPPISIALNGIQPRPLGKFLQLNQVNPISFPNGLSESGGISGVVPGTSRIQGDAKAASRLFQDEFHNVSFR